MNDDSLTFEQIFLKLLDMGITIKQYHLHHKVYQYELDGIVGKWDADKREALGSAIHNWTKYKYPDVGN